jgi:hypothetical protein
MPSKVSAVKASHEKQSGKDAQQGDGFCWGISRKKKRCGAKGYHPTNPSQRYYCRDHLNQQANEVRTIAPPAAAAAENDDDDDDDDDEFHDAVGDEDDDDVNNYETETKAKNKEEIAKLRNAMVEEAKRMRLDAQFRFLKCTKIGCANMSYERCSTKLWSCPLHVEKQVVALPPPKVDREATIDTKEPALNESTWVKSSKKSKKKDDQGGRTHSKSLLGLQAEDLPELIVEGGILFLLLICC